jgi:transcriptional regulator with XRE-family HTH domain
MDDMRIGQIVRALRHRVGWRQADLAAKAGLSDSLISSVEHGRLDGVSFGLLRRIFGALGVALRLDLGWRGAELDRLLDADHASLGEQWKRHLEHDGWLVRVELSFNVYGERGRIDLLAFHPVYGVLLVIEIKTRIADLQGLLGPLDIKVRHAAQVARQFGWKPNRVVRCLVLAEDRTNRRRVAQHASLLSAFTIRGRSALAWLRKPEAAVEGVLVFSKLPYSRQHGVRRAGRQRVRLPRTDASVGSRSTSAKAVDSAA